MPNFVYHVRSDKDTDFTTEIVQNAGDPENLVLPGALSGVGGNARIRIKNLAILSIENLAWEVWLFANDLFQESNLDADRFLGFWTFAAADAKRIAATGTYYYYVEDLDIPYVDLDNTSELHVMLVNRSAAAKTAGAAGYVVLDFAAEVEGP